MNLRAKETSAKENAAKEKAAKDMASDDKASPSVPDKPRVTTMEFFAQVRQETAKVTWPSIAETRLTSIAVFILVTLAMVFFYLVDLALGFIVSTLMNLV